MCELLANRAGTTSCNHNQICVSLSKQISGRLKIVCNLKTSLNIILVRIYYHNDMCILPY